MPPRFFTPSHSRLQEKICDPPFKLSSILAQFIQRLEAEDKLYTMIGAVGGFNGTSARRIVTRSESKRVYSLVKALKQMLKRFPRSVIESKAVIVKLFRPGRFLTIRSSTTLTSLYDDSGSESSFIQIAQPVISQPPISLGPSHWMPIEDVVVKTL